MPDNPLALDSSEEKKVDYEVKFIELCLPSSMRPGLPQNALKNNSALQLSRQESFRGSEFENNTFASDCVDDPCQAWADLCMKEVERVKQRQSEKIAIGAQPLDSL